MRLLMTTDIVGGVWTFTKELAHGLLDSGCEVVLISFGGQPSPDQQKAADKLSENENFQFICSEVPLEWMQRNDQAYSAAEPLLLRLCREFLPEALLLSQFCFGALPVGIPKIVIAHSDVFSWASSVGKEPLREDTWLKSYRTQVQSGLDGADMLIAPTEAALHSMRPHYSLCAPGAVVPNGRSVPPAVPPPARQLRAISAGRMWDPAKNLGLLAATASPMPILVAGEKPQQKDLDSSLTLLGLRNEHELLTLFRESAIYICCSIYEPFGLAPLEAALCGCAVVVNDIPSLREVWDDGALYFTNAETLAELLRGLASDASVLAQAQVRSGKRAETYSRSRMTEAYLQHIAAVVPTATKGQTRAA